jgi:hypothetical protein
MLIVDANTGFQPKVGDTFTNINGTITLLAVKEGIFSARALLRMTGPDHQGQELWVPLKVRYTHPGFTRYANPPRLMRKVAFIPS